MHPLIRDIQKSQLKKVPEIKTGYTVHVSQKISEGGKERIQAFEGLAIKVGHGEGAEKTFTLRKIVEGIGVEKTFPVHSPNITKIIIKKKAKVRRSKLYYMRGRAGKSARLSEHHVTDEERGIDEARMEEYIEEAVKAEEKRKKESVPAKAGPESEKADAGQTAETAEAEEPIKKAEEAVKKTEEAAEKAKEETEKTKEKPEEDKKS